MLRRLAPLVVLPFASMPAQQPHAFFDAAMAVLPADSPPFQALFDYDGDGDMDAVGSRVRQDGLFYEVRVWRNDQGNYTQVFGEVQPAAGGTGTTAALAVGDIDNDGDADFAVGTGLNYWIYRNQNGTWLRQSFATSNPIKVGALATGDFDGDTQVDLAIFLRDPAPMQSGSLQIRFGNGAMATAVVPPAVLLFARFEVFDLDGDAADELALWYVTENALHPFDYAGGTLTALPVLTAAVTAPDRFSYWSTGDLDGDTDTDIVAFELPTQQLPARVHCFRRVGTNAVAAETPYLGGPAEFLADADGDGDLDGVCCGGGSGSPPTWPTIDFGSTFEIALNDGTGTLAPAFEMSGLGSGRMAGVADVDGDGTPDFVAGAAIYYGRGTLGADLSPSAGLLDSGAVFQTNTWRNQLGDFDRDGDPDFRSALTIQCLNDGHGGFRRVTPTVVGQPSGMTFGLPQFRGDFDGDGAADFVAPLFQGTAFDHMAFVRNNGSGQLWYAGAAAGAQIGLQMPMWATTATSSLLADLDGDGDLDIVANADAAYEVVYHSETWWNDGNGFFTPGPTFATERVEAAVDLDGDGDVELVTRTFGGPALVRLGTGNVSAPWGAATTVQPTLALDYDVDTLLVVDANDDGRPDLLGRSQPSTTTRQFTLLCNTTVTPGAPSFQAATGVLSPSNWFSSGVSVFDVDGDGRSDLLQSSPAGRGFTVEIRRRIGGDGTVLQAAHFDPPVRQVIWDGFPADADGDGDIDLIGSRVVRNLTHHGAAAGLRQQYGAGSPGEGGIAPLLGVTGPVRVGEVVELTLSGVTGPSIALLAVGYAPAALPNLPFAGMTLWIDPSNVMTLLVLLPEAGGGQARGSARLPILLPPAIQGVDFWDQMFVFDPTASSGFVASNGLQKRAGG